MQFGYLTEKVSSRLGGWMNKYFSAGGKEVLLKSVIQSIPTYTMSCFKIPFSVSNDIERLCAKFWWGDKEKDRKMHWATWKELCKPKSKGGMGFRDLVAFNKSLIAKQVWRIIIYPESLAARLLKAKYFHDRDIMEAKAGSNASYVWRSILWGREVLKDGLRWKVGDGKFIKIVSDAWIPTLPNGHTFTKMEGLEEWRVETLLDENKAWDRGKMDNILLPVEVEEIMRIEIRGEDAKDGRYWMYDPKGMYSVKSGYLATTNYYGSPHSISDDNFAKWWKFLWSFDLPPRVKIFSWRAFKGFLPTEMNLLTHHVPVSGRCEGCKKDWGWSSHSLLFCSKVKQCWRSCSFWTTIKHMESFNLPAIGEAMRVKHTREEFGIWLMGMWMIWKGLCEEKYKDKRFYTFHVQSVGGDYIRRFEEARVRAALQIKVLPSEGSKKWRLPKKGRYRLDVDYAEDVTTGKGGIGAILRDDSANIVFALSKPVSISTSVLQGELRAAMHGICQCVQDGISPVEVFMDSILAIQVIEVPNEEDGIICDDLIQFFKEVREVNVLSFNHMRREANKAAHELASFAKSLATPVLWHDCWPSWLLSIVALDSS